MQSKAKTVEAYLAELPEDRREAISAVRDVIRENLPEGYAEGMAYGMIGYHVPHEVYPAGYHCDPKQPLPFAALASQKNHMALYLMCVYGDAGTEAWFRKEWAATGKKLDMGKSCVRFRKLADVPLAVVGRVIRRVPVEEYVARYEATLRRPRSGARKVPAKKATSKKTSKATTKKKAARAGAASTKAATRRRAERRG